MEQTDKMKNNIYKFWAACALVLGSYGIANANYVSQLTISDGVDPTTTVNGSGSLDWTSTVGVWDFNDVTGTLGGSATLPSLDLNFADSSSAAANLTITFSVSGFGPSPSAFNVSVGGTTAPSAGSSVTFSTFYSTANALPATTALTSPVVFTYPPSGFSEMAGVSVVNALTGPYSLSETIEIHNAGSGEASGDAKLSSVPDAGSTLILLGAAISALGVFAGFNRHQRNPQLSR
jgi:hypothetical protein